ncbi:MAG: hypothetical protein SRB2_03603 [Desulfobacteraceae bacterium Eth-SRB2]|nr:MAG: hypothetical protein SRB2_03603 [Desulfobacteraceae bacterium Eth-SRB2]
MSQSPRIGEFFPTEAENILELVSKSLNPLESGSSFQLKLAQVMFDNLRVSIPSNRGVLSNQMLWNKTSIQRKVSIPSNRGVLSNFYRRDIRHGGLKVSIPSNRGVLSNDGEHCPNPGTVESQSPRIGEFFPTKHRSYLKRYPLCLNPLESGSSFQPSSRTKKGRQ